MGYSHYWYRPQEIPRSAWKSFCEDVAKLIRHSPVKLVCRLEKVNEPPIVSDGVVSLNGTGAEGYEPFMLTRVIIPRPGERAKEDGLWLGFCKTEKRAYDSIVGACLIALKFHLGKSVRIQTDGSDDDWTIGCNPEVKLPSAKAFCQSVLGYGDEYEVQMGVGLVLKPIQTSKKTADA